MLQCQHEIAHNSCIAISHSRHSSEQYWKEGHKVKGKKRVYRQVLQWRIDLCETGTAAPAANLISPPVVSREQCQLQLQFKHDVELGTPRFPCHHKKRPKL